MKANRFSEAQIVNSLNQQQTGATVAKIIRKQCISEADYFFMTKYEDISQLNQHRNSI